MSEATEDVAKEETFRWKKKTKFPQDQCGISGCKSKPDGYMPSTRKGRLWYGPICTPCSVKACSHKPTPLSDLVLQRHGDEDLAKVLDIEVDEVRALIAQLPSEKAEQEPQSLQVAAIPVNEIEAWTKQADDVLQALSTFEIQDQLGMELASALLKDIKTLWQLIETARKAARKPFRDQLAKVQEKYKAPQEKLLMAEGILKQKITQSMQQLQQAQQAAMEAAQSFFQQGNLQATAVASQQVAATAVQLPEGLSQRTVLKWELVDIRQVPPEFLVTQVNAQAVEAALAQGITQIPGLRVFEVPTLAQRVK